MEKSLETSRTLHDWSSPAEYDPQVISSIASSRILSAHLFASINNVHFAL